MAGREGPPPGRMSEQQVQAGLRAINHPHTPRWKGARRPPLNWTTPKGAAEPDAGKGKAGGPPRMRPQTPDPGAEGGQPHTRATVGKPQATETPHAQVGGRGKAESEQSQVCVLGRGDTTPEWHCHQETQVRHLRHQGLRTDPAPSHPQPWPQLPPRPEGLPQLAVQKPAVWPTHCNTKPSRACPHSHAPRQT